MVTEKDQETIATICAKLEGVSKVVDLLSRFLDIRPITPDSINMAATAGTNDLKFDRVKAGRLQIISDFAAYNDTSASDVIRLGYHNGRRNQWQQSVPVPLVSEAVRLSGQIILFEGMHLVARVEGASSGDDLYAFANGFEILLGPSW